jgi:ADP-ribosyl-[dinitrogen reductase] hydrolase
VVSARVVHETVGTAMGDRGSRASRITGVLLGAATGDALGAGYEAGLADLGPDGRAEMIGGGLGDFAPGEWTDDTAMTVAIAQVLADGRLDLPAIGARFLEWARSDPPDIGISTREVLRDARDDQDLARAARDYLDVHPRGGAGNGALMRTAPVALAFLGSDEQIAEAARAVAELTHADPLAGDACVLWCIAIDRAVRDERLDGVLDGLDLVPEPRRDRWSSWLADAQEGPPERFRPNGFTVPALQGAWASCIHTPVISDRPQSHLEDALHRAIGIGDDTDTVAAIAGALLGGRWGEGAIPETWRGLLHGWPGLRAADLRDLALGCVREGIELRDVFLGRVDPDGERFDDL